MKIPNRLETERLILVPISLEYAETIFREFTPEITKYMTPPSPKVITETTDWITSAMSDNEAGTNYNFVILDKQTGEFIGGGGINHIDTRTPEFGIWTKKSSHGNKYGREAIHGAKKWADENLDYDYLLYPAVKENVASCKIAESMGGVVDHEYKSQNGSGEMQLQAEYRISREL